TEDIIYTIDLKQRITGVYGHWVMRMGLSSEHFVGKVSSDIVGKDLANLHESMHSRAFTGEIVTYEWSYEENNDVQYVQTKLSPIRGKDGVIIGLVGIGRYITQRRKAEIELKARIT